MVAKVTVLKNGVKVVTQKRGFSNTSILVLFKTGMLNETNEQNGISHFLEHALFLGTATKNSQELVDEIEKLGGYTNAYTSLEHTVFTVNVLPENWKIGLNYLADITQHSVFPEDKVNREREVIIQEIMRSKDEAFDMAYNNFTSLAYADQSMGRTILGPEENIRKFTREDLINYKNAGYTLDNMVVSAVGDIDHKEFVKEVEALFTELPEKCTLPRFKNVFLTGYKEKQGDVSQARLIMTLSRKNRYQENESEKAIYTIFKAILDGGMSTRLFQDFREKNGLGYEIGLLDDILEDTGYFGIFAGMDKENVQKAISVCKGTLDSMKADISDDELLKAKNLCLYNLSKANDKVEKLCDYNAFSLAFYGYVHSLHTKYKYVQRVTKQDVLDYANKYITDKYATTVLLPREEMEE